MAGHEDLGNTIVRKHSRFDFGTALRSLRWPIVAIAALEAVAIGLLQLGDAGFGRGSGADALATVFSGPFIWALVRLTLMIFPATFALHLLHAAWQAGRLASGESDRRADQQGVVPDERVRR